MNRHIVPLAIRMGLVCGLVVLITAWPDSGWVAAISLITGIVSLAEGKWFSRRPVVWRRPCDLESLTDDPGGQQHQLGW